MKELLKNIKGGLIFGFSAVVMVLILGIAYTMLDGTWIPPDNLEVNSGQILTSNSWNQTQLNMKLLEQRISILEGSENITNYSTGEIQTNSIWLDGKTIYKKTFHFNDLDVGTSATEYEVGIIENLDVIIKFEGVRHSGGWWRDIGVVPHYNNDLWGVHVGFTGGKVRIISLWGSTLKIKGYITVYYTKI